MPVRRGDANPVVITIAGAREYTVARFVTGGEGVAALRRVKQRIQTIQNNQNWDANWATMTATQRGDALRVAVNFLAGATVDLGQAFVLLVGELIEQGSLDV